MAAIVSPDPALERARMNPMAMLPADLKCLREDLGLSVPTLAAAIGTSTTTVERWEMPPGNPNAYRISKANAESFRRVVEDTGRAVDEIVASAGREIVVWSNDEEYRAAGGRYSAEWHRRVARRAKERTGAAIVYAQPS